MASVAQLPPDYHYDITVPGPHCFIAAGAIHHNTGKSEGAAQLDAAFLMGGAHPDVLHWLEANHLPLDRIPLRPGVVWSIGLTSNDSKAYIRPKVKRYLPPDWYWLNEFGNGVATATAPEWTNGGDGIDWFKSVDQGRRAMQGEACDLIRFDEEPDDYEVVKECRSRLIDRKGLLVFSMTPLRGWSKLLEEYVRKPDADVEVRFLSALDNPHVDSAEVQAILRKCSSAEKEARMFGKIAPLEGGVHRDFQRGLHTCKPMEKIPDHWRRYGGIDFGTRAPFVHLWFALDPADDTLHVYREHYQANATLRTHAEAIYGAELCPVCRSSEEIGSEKWWDWYMLADEGRTGCGTCGGTGRAEPEPDIRWADPENLDSRQTLNGEYGIATKPARKDRRISFEALFDRLALDAEGRPHLIIHECCVETIREVENLVWNEQTRVEMETKGDDHAHDVLRYVCYGLQRLGGNEAGEESE